MGTTMTGLKMVLRSLRRNAILPGSMSVVVLAAVLAAVLSPALAMVGGAPRVTGGTGQSVVTILGSYGTVCTATAVARDLLLTAAHCVQPGADYKLMGSKPGEPPVLKDIARIERDPQFDLKRL